MTIYITQSGEGTQSVKKKFLKLQKTRIQMSNILFYNTLGLKFIQMRDEYVIFCFWEILIVNLANF